MTAQITQPAPALPGVLLPEHNNTIITHFEVANHKSPFLSFGIPVTLHELSAGVDSSPPISSPSTSTSFLLPASSKTSFSGQFGIINFDSSIRLPRHVHIGPDFRASLENKEKQRFITERILVLNSIALVELNGRIYIIPPKTLVTIAPGVPHTWTACPAGVDISKILKHRPSSQSSFASVAEGETRIDLPVSDGTFLMVYEYEEVTGFFPTKQTDTLRETGHYVRCDDLEMIRFPKLSVKEIYERGWLVWGTEVWSVQGISRREE